MKLFLRLKSIHFLFIFFIFFIGCSDEEISLNERIENHKTKVLNLGDSLKFMDQKIDSLIKIYSK